MDNPPEVLDVDTGQTPPAPVAGEVITATAVVPSDAELNAAADRARGRTAVQVGIPTAVVIIAAWAARLAGIDLNPLPGEEELPADVVGAWVAVLTVVFAFRMNPKR